jgi:ABC-type oligopeptide transport system substrate-binding subunit
MNLSSRPDTLGRQQDELWSKSLEAIGVRLVVHKDKFPEQLKAEKACKLQSRVASWIADYPDGDNFMQLMYGPNTGQSNNGCYESKAFDALYEAAAKLPLESVERMKLFIDMSRQMQVDGAWQVSGSRLRNQLIRPWVMGYKKHPILQAEWMYLDLAPRS